MRDLSARDRLLMKDGQAESLDRGVMEVGDDILYLLNLITLKATTRDSRCGEGLSKDYNVGKYCNLKKKYLPTSTQFMVEMFFHYTN